jgi:hypothetical protein
MKIVMSEAILIEIAQRFRELEDCVEDPELYARESDEYEKARDELEKALEACREDMVTMQELIREKVLACA